MSAKKKPNSKTASKIIHGLPDYIPPTLITPQMARALLGANTKNRSINPKLVNQYIKDIKSGEWEANGETIKVAKSGRLLDGQHRLEAIVKSNQAVHGYIIVGVPDKSFKTIDIGRKRSPADALSVHGCGKNALIIAASLKIVCLFRENKGKYLSFKEREPGISHKKLIDMYESTPTIEDNVARIYQFQNVLNWISPSVAAALYTVMSDIDEDDAENFWIKFNSGAGLGETTPVTHLRNAMTNILSHNGGWKPNRRIAIAMIVKAWNLTRANKRIKQLEIDEGDVIDLAA